MPPAIRPQHVAGVGAVALMLAATRWGSHIGVGGIYLPDILILGATGHLLIGVAYSRFKGEKPNLAPLSWIALFITYCGCRFVASGVFNRDSIRDVAPFTFYAIVAFLAALTAFRPESRAKSAKLLAAALLFHAVWVAYARFFDTDGIDISFGEPLFSLRPDIDYTFVGVLGALILARMHVQREHRVLLGVVLLAVSALLLSASTRAGLFGGLSAMLLVGVLILYNRRQKGIAYLLVAVVPVVLVAGLPEAVDTPIGQRILASFDLTGSDNGSSTGSSTAKARREAWKVLIDWMDDSPVRVFVGAGSVNIMTVSHAHEKLVLTLTEDQATIRAPHNGWLSVYGHFGLLGVFLMAVVLWQFAASFWRNRRQLVDDPFLLLVYIIPAALLQPISYGVILESPFGAIPFWWCIGAALALDKSIIERQMMKKSALPWVVPRTATQSNERALSASSV